MRVASVSGVACANVDDIRGLFASMHRHSRHHEFDPKIEPDEEIMLEIRGASFLADSDHIFREPDKDYINREIEWYMTQEPTINMLMPPVPKIWQEVAGEYGRVNSQYGYLVFSVDNGGQYWEVIKELAKNPDSRRGVAIYNRPWMHIEATWHGMNDFICTNAVNYLIRDGKLHATVQMRSNDAVFGYRNDYAWQRFVLQMMADELDVKAGDIYWQVSSLHIYPRHLDDVKKFIESGKSS